MSLFKEKTLDENKLHSLGFTELQYVVHRRSSMVSSQHQEGCSTERPMMKEMSAGEESSLEERSLKFINSVRGFPWYKDYLKLMKEFKFKEIDATTMVEKMVELFQGHQELIAGFNQFLPETHKITMHRVVRQKRKRMDDSSSDSNDGGVDDARAKDSKIRKVIRSENKIKERSLDEEKESDDGHQAKRDDDSTAGSDEEESTELEKVIAFVNKVDERFRNNNDGAYNVQLFLDMVCKRSKSSPDRSTDAAKEELEIYKKVATLLGDHHDLIDEFTQFLTEVPRMDSIIDFHKCKRGTPSYRLLPMNFLIPAATGRSKLASEVLNDRWICVDTSPSTSSTTSSGGESRCKSQRELDLLDWEEEMCDNRVWEENVESSINTIKALIEKKQDMNPTKNYFEDLSRRSLIRCVKKIYGKRGCEMIDAVNNMQVGLPELLERFKQERKEFRLKRYDIEQKWALLISQSSNVDVVKCR